MGLEIGIVPCIWTKFLRIRRLEAGAEGGWGKCSVCEGRRIFFISSIGDSYSRILVSIYGFYSFSISLDITNSRKTEEFYKLC